MFCPICKSPVVKQLTLWPQLLEIICIDKKACGFAGLYDTEKKKYLTTSTNAKKAKAKIS